MKKIIALALSIILVLSFTAVAAAASPTDDIAEYYSIKTTIVNKCEAFASTDKVKIGSGDTVTFTAEEGDFMFWEFLGDYEVIEGEVDADGKFYDNIVTLKPLSDIKAYAHGVLDESREGGLPVAYYRAWAEAYPTDSGIAKAEPDKVKHGSDEYFVFTAEDTDGYSFVKWEITGEFDLVSGTFDENGYFTDKVVVVKPRSDVEGIASFEKINSGEEKKNDADKSTADEKGNTSSTSPKTGGSPIAVAVVMLTALCAAAFAIKKIRE